MTGSKGQIDRRALLLGSMAGLVYPTVAGAQAAPGKNPRPEVAFRVPEADPRVAGLVAEVTEARIRSDIDALTAFPTRWSEAPMFSAVEDWVATAFEASANGQRAMRQSYALPSGTSRNNIIWGNHTARGGVILVGAHLDSISERPGALAPGANDNASGIAALLEAQRILTGHRFQREIVYVAFTGEEQGLIGSNACANTAAREGWPIELMINLDMLGWHPPSPDVPLIIEYDQGNATPANDAAARAYAGMAAGMAAEHTGLATSHTNIWDSDYMGFEAAGFPCIGFYDGGAGALENHTTGDIPALLDYPRLTDIARLLVATLATAAELV